MYEILNDRCRKYTQSRSIGGDVIVTVNLDFTHIREIIVY